VHRFFSRLGFLCFCLQQEAIPAPGVSDTDAVQLATNFPKQVLVRRIALDAALGDLLAVFSLRTLVIDKTRMYYILHSDSV
jgi:hypothetical protein